MSLLCLTSTNWEKYSIQFSSFHDEFHIQSDLCRWWICELICICMYVCVCDFFFNHVLYITIKWTVFAAWVLCMFLHEAEPGKIWSFHKTVVTEFCVYLLASYVYYVCCEVYPNISITFGGTVFCIV
jgi:hypothetical protein